VAVLDPDNSSHDSADPDKVKELNRAALFGVTVRPGEYVPVLGPDCYSNGVLHGAYLLYAKKGPGRFDLILSVRMILISTPHVKGVDYILKII